MDVICNLKYTYQLLPLEPALSLNYMLTSLAAKAHQKYWPGLYVRGCPEITQ